MKAVFILLCLSIIIFYVTASKVDNENQALGREVRRAQPKKRKQSKGKKTGRRKNGRRSRKHKSKKEAKNRKNPRRRKGPRPRQATYQKCAEALIQMNYNLAKEIPRKSRRVEDLTKIIDRKSSKVCRLRILTPF